jgi:hypothetical protein
VTYRDEQLTHLRRLAEVLIAEGFTTDVVVKTGKPYLQVANADTPTLTERVLCDEAPDASWVFWWPWKQPIGSVDEPERVTEKIAAVLKSVEGA